MNNIYERQNDYQAIIYLKAAKYCQNKVKINKYIIIFLSVVLCLCGIFNRYLPDVLNFLHFDVDWIKLSDDDIANGITKSMKLKIIIDSYLSLASGILLLSQIFINRYTSRMHLEMNNLYERYDNYVYDLIPNKGILRPINETIIERYASKVWAKDKKFFNHYFHNEEEANVYNCIFENIRKQFLYDYKLMLSVKTFYKFLWYGFLAFIFIISLSFNKDFLSTLVTIIIPSLSIILMIFNSEHAYNEQMRYIQNNLAIMGSMREECFNRRSLTEIDLDDPTTLRLLQDSLFSHRASSFIIPNFLVKLVERRESRIANSDYLYKNNICKPIYKEKIIEADFEVIKPDVKPKEKNTRNKSSKVLVDEVKLEEKTIKPSHNESEDNQIEKNTKTSHNEKTSKKKTSVDEVKQEEKTIKPSHNESEDNQIERNTKTSLNEKTSKKKTSVDEVKLEEKTTKAKKKNNGGMYESKERT